MVTFQKRYTYRAATTAPFAAAAGADMFFVISGSASVKRYIHKVRASGLYLTTLEVETIVCEKWSTAPTGGTATTLTRTPLDSAFPAAQTDGLVQVYTAAPTEGTLVGTVAARSVMLKSSTVVDGAGFADVEFVFGDLPRAYELALNGTAQALSLAFAAAPGSAVSLSVEVEYSEQT